MPTNNQWQESTLRHYQRMSHQRSMAATSVLEGGVEVATGDLAEAAIQDRVEVARESLRKIVEKYLKNDPKMLEIADRIVAEGAESLRQLAGEDIQAMAERPLGFEGLEAIIRTDGSRPSFLVQEGEVDRESSPLGDWGGTLDRSEAAIRNAIACVGRIDVPGSIAGFQGTGFLIHENLIVTNRHVLQVSARQDSDGNWRIVEGAAIDFGHEFESRQSVNRRLLSKVLFTGSEDIDFYSIDHRKLDLALIELEPADSERSEPQSPFKLRFDDAWSRPGTRVFIIGYPGSPPSFVYAPTLLEQLFQSTYGYKRLAPGEIITAQNDVSDWTIAHDATTLGGNSGSVVLAFEQESSVAALHYGGRSAEPRENWGHNVGRVLDETDGRASTTLREILNEYGVDAGEAVAMPVDRNGATRISTGDRPGTSAPPRITQPAYGGFNWRQGVTLAMMHPLVRDAQSRVEGAALEAAGDGETHADDFAGRDGYVASFISDWNIPLPRPDGDMRRLRRGGDGVELKYEHFSVIMHKDRRMPIITACNINGGETRRLPRITQWSYDGRLNREDQWGNELYLNNELDRGHMVRREDPVWGSLRTARRANVDTFHYTNSCPQMAGVNQAIWLGLENYILSHTREDEMFVSVFTGPFFGRHDLPYRDALIPRAFWKVVAFVTEEGRPSATAYKVSQARELQDLEFVFAGYRTFQISIQQVADATGINFDELIQYDGFSQHERVHGKTISEQLESLSQIRV
jgi:endonuclease G, mitochondrial